MLNTKKKKIEIKKFFFFKRKGECLKILTHKQMLQWASIAYAQVKAGNISENLQNEIRQIIHKIDLWRKDKYIVFSNLSIYYTWKNDKAV